MKLGLMALASSVIDACVPKSVKNILTVSPTLDDPQDFTSEPQDSSPTMKTNQLDEIATSEPLKLSPAERAELLAKPEFFTEILGTNTKKIMTSQFDDSEYLKINRRVFPNNNCGQSVLATTVKMCEYFKTGYVPDYTISDVDMTLDEFFFTDIKGHTEKIITPNDQMYFVGFSDALNLLLPQKILKTEFLTPNNGSRYTRIVFPKDLSKALTMAQTTCEEGGFVIIHGLKYQSGHIILATNVKGDGTATIVDSRTAIDSQPGTVHIANIRDYFESRVDPDAEFLGKQPGILNMLSVTFK